jgi:hypothetical protein
MEREVVKRENPGESDQFENKHQRDQSDSDTPSATQGEPGNDKTETNNNNQLPQKANDVCARAVVGQNCQESVVKFPQQTKTVHGPEQDRQAKGYQQRTG